MYTIVQLKYGYNYMLINLSRFSFSPRFKCATRFKNDSGTFFGLDVLVVPIRVNFPYFNMVVSVIRNTCQVSKKLNNTMTNISSPLNQK